MEWALMDTDSFDWRVESGAAVLVVIVHWFKYNRCFARNRL